MRRPLAAALCVIVVVAGALVLSSRRAAGGELLTPDGPATLSSPEEVRTFLTVGGGLLMGVRVRVAEGGEPGRVRVRVVDAARSDAVPPVLGPPVALPATAGVHVLPAPRTHWVIGASELAIDQTTGRHAIVRRCRSGHPCALAVHRPPVPADLLRAGPASRTAGRELSIEPIVEPDFDGDLLSDRTEDRTDLRLRSVLTRTADKRLRLRIDITNAGARAADLPVIYLSGPSTRTIAAWEPECRPPSLIALQRPSEVRNDPCQLPALPAGARARFAVTMVPDNDAGLAPGAFGGTAVTAEVFSEGADTRPGDNTARASLP